MPDQTITVFCSNYGRLLVLAFAFLACSEELQQELDKDAIADTTACHTVSAWEQDFIDFENQVVELINTKRRMANFCGEQFLAPTHMLESSPNLRCAARLHAQTMQQNNFFGYIDPHDSNTPEPQELLLAADYTNPEWEQNIAAGWPSAETVVDGWLASQPHCEKLFDPTFTEIGMGVIKGEKNNDYQLYWTLFLGAESSEG